MKEELSVLVVVMSVLTMHTFFHGWRRKAGVVQLVLACVLMGLWMRSLFFADQIVFSIAGRTHHLVSALNGFGWLSLDAATSANAWHTISTKVLEERHFDKSLALILTEMVDEQTKAGMHPTGFYLLYWWLVPPLSLVSAYLILWKPRKRVTPDA